MRKTLLILALLLLVISPRHSQAQAQMELSSRMGMNMLQLSQVYRKMPGAKEWTQQKMKPEGSGDREQIWWKFADHPGRTMHYFLTNGRVDGIIIADTRRQSYAELEELLNRTLMAFNDHIWLDTGTRTLWELSINEGRVLLTGTPAPPRDRK
ncbi:hypothetical protein GCM10027048_14120 [Hymenobacter coalescens]